MSIIYQRATRDDLAPAQRVWESAIYDLERRHGYADKPVGPFPPNPFFEYALDHESNNSFWIAEDRDRVIGIALSWMRGSFWFLSYLFVLPTYQGRGIGNTLISKTLEKNRSSDITNRALITLAYNPVSISLYMRNDMYPREPLYWMSAPRERLKAIGASVKSVEHEEVGPLGST